MESTIVFVEGRPFEGTWGLWKRAVFTPVYMDKDGKRFHVCNLVEPIKPDPWDRFHAKHAAEEVERAKRQLTNNGGAFYCEYGRFSDPIRFIEWVKEQGYTFEVLYGNLFWDENGITHFHGNLMECSAAFSYWIYDQSLADSIKKLVEDMPKYKRF